MGLEQQRASPMKWFSRMWRWSIGLIAVAALVPATQLFGQANQPPGQAAAAPPAAEPTAPAAVPQPAPTGPPRTLAPWVMKKVDPNATVSETVSRHDIVELTAVDPKFDWAKDVAFRRDIWHLEFQFKPLRRILVDVPQDTGKMQRKPVWYLVYQVTNTGKVMHPVAEQDGTYKVEQIDQPIRFVPEFLLYSPEFNKTYPDRVIPTALGPIRMREDRNREFLTTVDAVREIAPGQTLWGVAMWEDLDPRIDRFSIFVHGLTNAYEWQDQPGVFKPGSPLGTGRRLARKTLQLNFWWPGDDIDRGEDEIRFGIPGEVDYQWVYR
jgi:hypothetical protein